MGRIEEVFEELETDMSIEQFRDRVSSKIEEVGGLMDEESAAMLVAHELDGNRPIPIGEIDPELERVTVLGVVRHIGERRSFERDDGGQGSVINIELADASGQVRAAFWDEMAVQAEDELVRGDTLRVRARPREGFNGLELSVTDVMREEETEVTVAEPEVMAVDELTPGMEGVVLLGEVLRVDAPRTFDRDDGSEGRVATVVIGDETGAIDVTLWGDATDATDDITVGSTVRIEGASARERDGRLEVHLGGRAVIEPSDESVTYEPVGGAIESLTEGETATITGIVRSTDPVRTFDRDDGSEGKVRNLQVQDTTDSIRVALWGEKAETDLAPGDEVTCIDVLIKEGFRDDLEASANWRSTIVERSGSVEETIDVAGTEGAQAEQPTLAGIDTSSDESSTPGDTTTGGTADTEEPIQFTGTVVQPGSEDTPLVLDNGEETMHVETDEEVMLGERLTVVGRKQDDRLVADRLERATNPT